MMIAMASAIMHTLISTEDGCCSFPKSNMNNLRYVFDIIEDTKLLKRFYNFDFSDYL